MKKRGRFKCDAREIYRDVGEYVVVFDDVEHRVGGGAREGVTYSRTGPVWSGWIYGRTASLAAGPPLTRRLYLGYISAI